MTSNNFFKWNNNNNNNNSNSNNNDNMFGNSMFGFNASDNNNNNNNTFNILPDDEDNIDFQNILNNKNGQLTGSTTNAGIFGTSEFGQSQFGTQSIGGALSKYDTYSNNSGGDIQIQDIDNMQQQQQDEDIDEIDQQFNKMFNDKSISDDLVFHRMLENEYVQPKITDPDELPIYLSNIFLKLSKAKVGSIESEDSNKLFYLTTNRKQKDEELNNYQLEKDTWNLISKLYAYRDIEKFQDQDEKIELNNPTQVQVFNYLIKKDSTIRENSIILEWLEEMAPDVDYTTDRVFWEHTLSKLEKSTSSGMVTELDPDASSRQNKKIDSSDEINQHKFFQSLWGCLRHGYKDRAVELCTSVEQYWRAQTLLGLHYYDGENEIGNPYFNLWKSNCFNISKNASDQFERAIYGLLSGNLEAVLPIQKNWYDYFWCYLRVLFDEKIYKELKPYRSPLSIEEDLDTPPSNTIAQINSPNDIMEILKNKTSQTEIRNQSKNPYHIVQELIIQDNYKSLFEVLPKLLLKNRTPEFNRFAVFLIVFYRKRESYMNISDSEDCPENIVINEYIQYLIKTQQYDLVALYTSLLINEDLQTKVYSKFLVSITDQEQIHRCLVLAERFGLHRQEIALTVVNYITSGEVTSNQQQQQHQQQSIINGGEDLLGFGGKSVLNSNNRSTINNSNNNNNNNILNSRLQIDTIDPSVTTPDDIAKIESIKYLCGDQQLFIKALEKSNLLIREFIKLNKFGASIELLKLLPKEIVLVAKQQSPLIESDTINIIKEFRDWENYITANTRINSWLHNFANKPQLDSLSSFHLTGKESYAEKLDIERRKKEYEYIYGQWNQNNINYGKEALESIKSVLKTGWLCPLENQVGDFDESDEDSKDIVMLRKKCIPNLFKSLHTVLVGVGSIKKSTKICNQISNEQYKWYSVFSKKELQEILQLVRDSSIKLFDHHQI